MSLTVFNPSVRKYLRSLSAVNRKVPATSIKKLVAINFMTPTVMLSLIIMVSGLRKTSKRPRISSPKLIMEPTVDHPYLKIEASGFNVDSPLLARLTPAPPALSSAVPALAILKILIGALNSRSRVLVHLGKTQSRSFSVRSLFLKPHNEESFVEGTQQPYHSPI